MCYLCVRSIHRYRVRPSRKREDDAIIVSRPILVQLTLRFFHPLGWLRVYFCSGLVAAILASASFESTDRADRHVLVAEHLATESYAGQFTSREQVLFSCRHLCGLAVKNFDAASRAAGVAAASVKLIDSSFILQCQYQTLALGNFEFSDILHC